MPEFIALTCPSCGGKLQITPDLGRFACGHCGNEHMVRRGGGVVSLAPVVEGIQQVRAGVDKTASELAIRRLKEEIGVLQSQRAEAIGQLEQQLPPRPQVPTNPLASLTFGNILTLARWFLICVLLSWIVLAFFGFRVDLWIWLLGNVSVLILLWAIGDRQNSATHSTQMAAYQTRRAEIDAQIEAGRVGVDAEIAAKTAELNRHTQLVSGL